MKEIENRIVVLKQKMLGPDSAQAISEEDLVLFNSLIYSEGIDVETLQKIDQELYKELIVKLVHQRTDNSRQLSSLVFRDLADLHEKLADLTLEQDAEEVRHFTLSSRHKKLKYYTDSATFLQYSLLNSQNKDDIENQIYSKLSAIEAKILRITDNSNTKTNAEKVKVEAKNYKNILIKLRSECIAKLEIAEDKSNEQKETVQSVFECTTDKMKSFLKKIYEDTIRELEQKPPCNFAIVGLGSMTLKQITPWSDLEFAILLEKETPQIKQYFRDLSHIVNLKMINLGETIIPTSKYRMDMSGFGKVGVNFDLGGKTPLGRISGDKPYDLIGTKDWLMWYVKNEKNKATHIDKNLPYILENVAHICGDVGLVEAYQEDVAEFLHQDYEGEEDKYKDQGLKNHRVRALKILEEGCLELEYTPSNPLRKPYKDDLERIYSKFIVGRDGSLLDVKQGIYELTDRMIYNLGAFFGIYADSAWNTIRELKKSKIISEEGDVSLRKAIDFATSLRLKSYNQNGNQIGSVSTYIPVLEHLPQEEQEHIINKIFHVEDKSELYSFYYTAGELLIRIMCMCDVRLRGKEKILFQTSDLRNASTLNQAGIHEKFLDYKGAIKLLENDSKYGSKDLEILEKLYVLYSKRGYIDKAVLTAERILEACLYSKSASIDKAVLTAEKIVGWQPVKLSSQEYSRQISYYNYSGRTLHNKGKYNEAIECYKKSLKLLSENNFLITIKANLLARTYQYLGETYIDKKIYAAGKEKYFYKAKYYLVAAQELYRSIHGDEAKEALIVNCIALSNLYDAKQEYDLAKLQLDEALKMCKMVYSNNPNHTHIGLLYSGLGRICNNEKNYDKAEEHFKNALAIYCNIYNHRKHQDIAGTYYNLGQVFTNKGLKYADKKSYSIAKDYTQKALKMYCKIYGNTIHPNVIDCYHSLELISKAESSIAKMELVIDEKDSLVIIQQLLKKGLDAKKIVEKFKAVNIHLCVEVDEYLNESKPGNITNLNQWYEDERIEELLKKEMQEDKARVLAITQFENKDLLEGNLNNALECIKKDGLPVLMPIHVHGNHWVGAVIRKQSDGKIQVIYNDPKGNSIQDEENIITFISIIQKHEKDANIIDLQLKQQNNDDDCGPFTVDNLVRLAMAHGLDNATRDQLIERDVLPSNNIGAMVRVEHEELLLGGNKNETEISNDDEEIDTSLVVIDSADSSIIANPTDTSNSDTTGVMGDW
ncbi:MAG TPA: Ulp1 family isopeptidase [Candidatus Megaira endosymbiont of Nemacystus decipiens]|nr:Ulp1 family isopeptidase [Candidatus Megaera endosymbiont of Nemacystus decipiens]